MMTDSLRQMIDQLQQIRRGLQQHSDSEHEQALFRILIVSLICIYFYFEDMPLAWSLALAYLPLSLGGLFWIVRSPAPNRVRRLTGITADVIMVSLGVIMADGEAGVVFVTIYLWIITGNGFRFGLNYLVYATLISLAAFIPITLLAPFWHQHPALVVSVLIILAVVPVFMATLIRKLNHAIESAEAANLAKSRFIANMSHELRTPLNGIIGMNDLMLASSLSRQQRRYAGVIHESASHLLGLIERILDISKIEAGKMELVIEPVDLRRLMRGTVDMFEAQVAAKGIAMHLYIAPDVPSILRGDAARIRQVLVNIIGNAVKFTEQGGVEVRVERRHAGADDDEQAGDHLWLDFIVQDSGIGMSEAEQARIFELFTQADSSITRRFGGTGLGTTIARHLSELMGGGIRLQSRPGEGSTFVISLPFEFAADEAVEGTAAAGQLPPLQLLLLTGAACVQQLDALLQGWSVASHRQVESEAELLAALDDGQCDACIVEISMLQSPPHRLLQLLNRRVPDGRQNAPKLILIDSEECLNQTLPVDGCAAVLRLPLQASLLFHALYGRAAGAYSGDVICIADALQRRQAADPMQILVAEDNPVNQEVIRAMLHQAGHRVHLVEDGEQALEALAGAQAFDLVLLDLNMPKIGGLDVLRQFRFMDTEGRTPVLILSADAQSATIRECMQAGARGYLIKPLRMEELLEKLAACGRDAQQPEPTEAGDCTDERKAERVLDDVALDDLFGMITSPHKRRHLLQTFLSSGEEHLTQLAAYARAGQAGRFLDQVHAFKGSAATLGVVSVQGLCQEIETLSRDQLDAQRLAVYAQQLEIAFRRGIAALRQRLEQ